MLSKVWLITGGSRGIGKSIFKKCIDSGDLAVICSRSSEEVNKAIESVDPKSEKSFGIVADVANKKDCQTLINKTLEKFGRIDVLVNNAGIYGPIGRLDDVDIADWETAIKINLLGTVYCTQTVLPVMKKQGGGKIINLAGAGVGGSKVPARFSAYFTSKMAIAGFTEVMAAEVKDDNIQINCISPGGVNTFFTDYLIEIGEEKVGNEMYHQALRQKETGGDSPELAAKLVLFLASKEADYITGKIISAKWDDLDKLKDKNFMKDNLYNLRRIDDFKFYEK